MKNYSVTIPSVKYLKIDDYSGIGVDNSNYLISMNIRGWSGANPYQLLKSNDGTAIYIMGESGAVSFSVEYFFASPSIIDN